MGSVMYILAFGSLFLLSAFGAPEGPMNGIRSNNKQERSPKQHASRDSSCMNKDEAQQVATNFKDLIVEYSDSLANSSLTVDFVDYSDSVIELINSGCTNSVQDVSFKAIKSVAHELILKNLAWDGYFRQPCCLHRRPKCATLYSLGAAQHLVRGAHESVFQCCYVDICFRHTCTSVTVRWLSKGEGQEPQQVTGIVVLETEYSSGSWLINKVYSEFNSGAWLVNIGVFEPSGCSG